MHEYIAMSAGPDFDLIGDKTGAVGFQVRNRSCQVGNMDSYMVHTFTAFLQEFGDDGIGAGGLQQFDPAFTERNHVDLYFLVSHHFFGGHSQAQPLIELARLLQRFHRNTEMVNGVGHFYSPGKQSAISIQPKHIFYNTESCVYFTLAFYDLCVSPYETDLSRFSFILHSG